MAPATVSFAIPPSSESKNPTVSPASSVMDLAETTPKESPVVRAILDNLSHLVISPERLTFVDHEPVARGGLCDVYFAKLDETSETPRDVAVERLSTKWLSDKDKVRTLPLRLARQLKAWEGLRHPNVLELLGYYLSPDCDIAQLISPYLINGGLHEYLKQTPVGLAQRLAFIRDVTAGLDYLHTRNLPICHGDLNPQNILVDTNLNAVLSCFGLACDYNESNTPSGLTTEPMGTFKYMSPELTLGVSLKYTLPSDVWAWGCTAFEILTNEKPFHEKINQTRVVFSMIERQSPGKSSLLLSLVPDAAKPEHASTLRLLHSYLPLCWDYEPRKRPLISVLLRQVFMFSFESDPGDSVVATLNELAHLLVLPERLRLLEGSELGAGKYGEVTLGTLDESTPNPRDVAVKRLKAVGTRGERVRLAKRLARELNIWAKIKHPNVLELIGYYLDEKYEYPLLISELMVNGNVLEYIERFNPNVEQRIAFVKGITAGLACLHNFDPAICHADLKPANVLIDLQMNAVLCDFGLASFVSGSGISPGLVTSTTIKGTPRYMSPELLLENDCTHTLESDIWAWACTVFQILTGLIPYAEILGEAPCYMAIVQGKFPGNITLWLPNDKERVDSESALALQFLYSTLPQCWEFDPQNRPSICTLLSHLSDLSPQTETGVNGNKDVPADDTQTQPNLYDISSQQEGSFSGNEGVTFGGLEEKKLAEALEAPSRNCEEVGSAREAKRNVPTAAHPDGEGVHEANSELVEEEPPVKRDAHGARLEEVTAVTPDQSSRKILPQPSSMLILAAVCILSLCANMFLLLRNHALRDQEAARPTYRERDL